MGWVLLLGYYKGRCSYEVVAGFSKKVLGYRGSMSEQRKFFFGGGREGGYIILSKPLTPNPKMYIWKLQEVIYIYIHIHSDPLVRAST